MLVFYPEIQIQFQCILSYLRPKSSLNLTSNSISMYFQSSNTKIQLDFDFKFDFNVFLVI